MYITFTGYQYTIEKLLKRLSRRFNIDFSYFITNGIYLNSATFMNAVFALILSVFFSRFLSKEIVGQYSFVLSIVGIASFFALPGMRNAIIQSVAKGYFKNYKIGIHTSLQWSFLGSLVLLGFSVYYFWTIQYLLGITFFITALWFSPYTISSFYTYYLSGQKRFNEFALCSFIVSSISTGLLLVAVFFLRTLPALILTFFLSTTLINGFLTIRIYKNIQSNEVSTHLLKLGKYLSFFEVFQTVAFYLDSILVGVFLGFHELAVYHFANVLPEQIKSVAKSIGELALPKLSTMGKMEIRKVLMKRFWQFTALMFFVAIVYILLSPFIYKILFPQYGDAVFYSQIFSISFVAFPLILFNYTFQAFSLKKEILWSNITSPLIQIVLLITLLPLYGLVGVAVARVFGRFFSLVFNIYLFKRSSFFQD